MLEPSRPRGRSPASGIHACRQPPRPVGRLVQLGRGVFLPSQQTR